MRSTLLLSAVCAAGVWGTPLDIDKRVYETDWSYVTLTETSTAQPVAAATTTYAPAQAVQETENVVTAAPVTSTSTLPPAPAQTTTLAPAPADNDNNNNANANTNNVANDVGSVVDSILPTALTSSWSTEWTSTPTQAPTTMSSTTSSAGSQGTNAYQQAILYHHNIHRSNHSANSLTWSDNLQASAQKLAARCVYEHDTSIDGGGYGQNIGYGVEESNIGQMITNLMYNDEMGFFSDLYGLASPLMALFDSWGHFSQIVWKSTTQVGCATVMCDSLGNIDASRSLPFTVCNYNPAGNTGGEYADNVLKPLGQPMFTA
ncbi:CAP domain-containing protein [Aspergillus chevalieri]|uniref:SCP domain-containing protein n=1 Tax=Aspergillus chevalieri TaxID=182096 RepID=A0A7R7VLY4_ASPCH|nr:uncharacterized protein ACHE_30351S [Aspergillus chevalieri]BCR86364.1 hypothetical protein ACHE_30351S [Aspergillus chevalieri]